MTQPLRLAYLISQYPAISHTFILREVRHLRALGLHIQVASINAPDRKPDQLTKAECEEADQTFYIKPAGLIGALKAHFYTLFTRPFSYLRGFGFAVSLGQWDLKKILYGIFYFVEAVMLGHWMRSHQLTHVHVHIPMAAATVALIAKRTFSITFSMTVHGPNEFYETSANYLSQKIQETAFICCISHFARSQLMMLSSPACWDKFELNRLGVDPSTFTPCPYRDSPSPFEVLCVGRLVSAKGQFILIQAVARLLAQGREVRLRFVGEGPDRQTLQEYVNQQRLNHHIVFAGAVNQEHIQEFYHQTDVFAIASFAEGIPVVLMEAMVMEIACISTHITGIPELIGQGQGILVPPSDVESLTHAIALLMDNPQLRRQIGQAGRDKILQEYELQKNVIQLAKIFQNRLRN